MAWVERNSFKCACADPKESSEWSQSARTFPWLILQPTTYVAGLMDGWYQALQQRDMQIWDNIMSHFLGSTHFLSLKWWETLNKKWTMGFKYILLWALDFHGDLRKLPTLHFFHENDNLPNVANATLRSSRQERPGKDQIYHFAGAWPLVNRAQIPVAQPQRRSHDELRGIFACWTAFVKVHSFASRMFDCGINCRLSISMTFTIKENQGCGKVFQHRLRSVRVYNFIRCLRQLSPRANFHVYVQMCFWESLTFLSCLEKLYGTVTERKCVAYYHNWPCQEPSTLGYENPLILVTYSYVNCSLYDDRTSFVRDDDQVFGFKSRSTQQPRNPGISNSREWHARYAWTKAARPWTRICCFAIEFSLCLLPW